MKELEDYDVTDDLNQILDQKLDRFEKGHDHFWQGQLEFGKTLITLSSGALVFSISIIQFTDAEQLTASFLLLISWIFFIISILSSTVRFTWYSIARSFRMVFESNRWEIEEKVSMLDVDDLNYEEKVDRIVGKAFKKASKEANKAGRVFDALSQTAFWSFTFGIIVLTIYAFINLP